MKKVGDILSDKKDDEITKLNDRVLTLEKENKALLAASGKQQREVELLLHQQQSYRDELVGKKRLEEQLNDLIRMNNGG
jgi:predicted RNase H-like nuclease (RuvC/YqgF family)